MSELNSGLRRHLLLPQEIRKRLPRLGSTENELQPIAQVKFFSPYSGWYWYASEFDGVDTFFGLVIGWETEYGYFSFLELQETLYKGYVPAVERDCGFRPGPIKEFDKR